MSKGLNTADMLLQLFGVNTTEYINRIAYQVQNTVTRILSNDPKRVSFAICNLSANSIYFGPFEDVASTKGFFIAANGGIFSFQYDRDFNIVTRDWYAIAAGINSNVLIMENCITPGV